MPRIWQEYGVFFKQFRQQFRTTGAVAPSGPWLAAALARYVRPGGSEQRILEVGPGTGAVTAAIVRRLGPHDHLDLVELNESFVVHLQKRFAEETDFVAVAARSRVLHQRLEELPHEAHYDLIVSGLPLNNFSPAEVVEILATLRRLLRPQGVLSFFEYIGVRAARSYLSASQQRLRLRQISEALRPVLQHEVRRDWIFPNLPPAWVHHVRFPSDGNGTADQGTDKHSSGPQDAGQSATGEK